MKKKRTPCTFLIVTLIIGVAIVGVGISASTQPLIYLEPSTYTATILGEFTINISIANASNLRVAELRLGYNTTLLDTINVAEGPFMKTFGETIMYKEIHEDLGYLLVAIAITTGGPAQGNGTLTTITFNSTYYGPASCALDLFETELSDPEGAPIPHDVADGYYEFVILGLTVAMSKQSYSPEEVIEIYGNLTRNSAPMDGLVALEVTNPNNQTIMFRTLKTGTNPEVGNVTIVDLYPSDEWGYPKNNFNKDTIIYFNVTIKNNDIVKRNVAITVNPHDSNNVPFGAPTIKLSILPDTSASFIPPVPIPYWVSTGTGKAYASAFTDLPSLGGVAYCTEKSAAFNILGSGGSSATLDMQESSTNSYALKGLADLSGNYNLTFKIFSGAETPQDNRRKMGTYKVFVSSSHEEWHEEKNTTFKFKVPGDVDGDGHVDIKDLLLFSDSWYKSPPDPLYNPNADFNNNGIVDIFDLIILSDNWYRW